MGGRGWRQADMELGARWKPEPPSVVASVLDTGLPARSDDYSPTSPSLPAVDADDGLVRLAIRDYGVGGADPTRGSGLIGLKDRVEASGGTLHVESRP
jgi:hypothetical protein